MKLISYNIRAGGFDSYSYSSNFPERFGLIKKAVIDSKADFVGLIDTFRWKDIFTEEELKEHFGYKKAFCINMDDSRIENEVGITILTNLDARFEKVKIYNRNCVKSLINYKGKEFFIWVAYLDDLSENVRLKEIGSLLEKVSLKNTIILGDFNTFANSDLNYFSQGFDKVKDRLFREMPDLNKVLEEMRRCEVVSFLEEKGFVNGISSFHPTIPTKLYGHGIKEPFARIDYVFHTCDVNIKSAGVLNFPYLQKASDHLPIYAEL